MDKLVGILRTEDALTARRIRRRRTVDFEDCGAVLDACSEAGAPWYEFTDGPLALPQHSALLADWNILRDAVTPDAEAARRVLAETVLGQPVFLPPVTPPTPPAPVKPTAAHPHVHQGTKLQRVAGRSIQYLGEF